MFSGIHTVIIIIALATLSQQEKSYSKVSNRISYEELKVLPKHAFKDYPAPMGWEVSILIEGANLTTIEPEAFLNVKIHSIDITYNELETLTKGMFVNVSVRQLFINDNKIKTIEAGTFDSIRPYDRYGSFMLGLYKNRLESISKGWFNNLDINSLFLSDNRITFIEKGSFENMPSLERIDLAGNLLETIDEGIFNNLGDRRGGDRYLKFAQNKINFVNSKAFEGNNNLHLYLDLNMVNITKEYFTNSEDIVQFVI